MPKPGAPFPHQSPDILATDAQAQADSGMEDPTDRQKYDKVDVNYRPAGGATSTCGNCAFYRTGGTCSQVDGNISPTAVCDLWQSGRAQRGMGALGDLIS